MRLFVRFLIPLPFLTILLGSCNKDNNLVEPGGSSFSLDGRVTDSLGNTIEGCGVHYIFSLASSPLAKIDETCPSTVIGFTLPERSKVTIKVLRLYTRDLISTPFDDTLDAGWHSVVYDGSDLTNGIYIYQIITDSTVSEHLVMQLETSVTLLEKTVPIVRSNSSGEFSLPYGVMGFGIPFPRSSVSGQTLDTVYVSHTIQIVLSKTGYVTTVKTLTIDEGVGVSQEFTLGKQ